MDKKLGNVATTALKKACHQRILLDLAGLSTFRASRFLTVLPPTLFVECGEADEAFAGKVIGLRGEHRTCEFRLQLLKAFSSAGDLCEVQF